MLFNRPYDSGMECLKLRQENLFLSTRISAEWHHDGLQNLWDFSKHLIRSRVYIKRLKFLKNPAES